MIRKYLFLLLFCNSIQAIAKNNSIGTNEIALTNKTLGDAYWKKSDYYKALEYYEMSFHNYEKGGDKKNAAYLLQDIGDVYSNAGLYDFPKALEAYNKAYIILNNLNDSSGIAINFSKIGTLYFFTGNLQKALEYQNKALLINQALNDSANVAYDNWEIARLYCDMDDYDKALNFLNKSQKTYEQLKDSHRIESCFTLAGEIYLYKSDNEKALELLNKSLNLAQSINESKHNISFIFQLISEVFLNLKNYSKAMEYARKELKLSQETNDLNMQRSAYSQISNIYEKEGKYSLSLYAYKIFKEKDDSISNSEKTKQIVKEETQFEFEKRESITKAEQEKKDIVTKKEIEKQKLIRNVSFTGAVLFVLFSSVLYNRFRLTKKQKTIIEEEKRRSEDLLLNILPLETAEELKQTGSAKAKKFDSVSVMFTDFKNFTQASEKLSAEELVQEINYCYKEFDKIITAYGVEKIKTIGDSYMAAGGLPVINNTHPNDVVKAALEIKNFMDFYKQEKQKENKPCFEIRIGIHSGSVVAGIVGIKKFAYDIWGDTVNIASRMESSGEAGKVNISGATYALVKEKFTCTHRGKIQAKNKGEIDMYYVETVS